MYINLFILLLSYNLNILDAPGKVTKVELIPDPPERDSDLTVLADVDLDGKCRYMYNVNSMM